MQKYSTLQKIRVGNGPPPEDFPNETDLQHDPHADRLAFSFSRVEGGSGYTLGLPGRLWGAMQDPAEPTQYRVTPLTDIGAYAPVAGGELAVPDTGADGGYYPFGDHPFGVVYLYMEVATIAGAGPVHVLARTSSTKGQI